MEPERSVTAAMTVYLPDMKLHLNWKLSPELSIMGAVLHAIYQAILYVSWRVQHSRGVVILSDSLNSILSLQSRRPNNYAFLIFKIQELVIDLNRNFTFMIQYIPAHRNIEDNELADLGAKASHNSNYITPSPLSGRDFT